MSHEKAAQRLFPFSRRNSDPLSEAIMENLNEYELQHTAIQEALSVYGVQRIEELPWNLRLEAEELAEEIMESMLSGEPVNEENEMEMLAKGGLRGISGQTPKERQEREDSQKRIKKYLTKEEEEVNELSKATLGSYINKASTKRYAKGVTHGFADGVGLSDPQKTKRHEREDLNKSVGIKRATDRLTKEELSEEMQVFVEQYLNHMNEQQIVNLLTMTEDTLESLYGEGAMDTVKEYYETLTTE